MGPKWAEKEFVQVLFKTNAEVFSDLLFEVKVT